MTNSNQVCSVGGLQVTCSLLWQCTWPDPRPCAPNHRASPAPFYTGEHIWIMHCSSCRNCQVCTALLSCGFRGTRTALCGAGSRDSVLLGALCWHCCATFMTRANISMQHPAVGSAQRSSTAMHHGTMWCRHTLGSLAKVTQFLPTHATATVQHPAAFIEKEWL